MLSIVVSTFNFSSKFNLLNNSMIRYSIYIGIFPIIFNFNLNTNYIINKNESEKTYQQF